MTRPSSEPKPPYRCSYCFSRFTSEEELAEHVREVHPPDPHPYEGPRSPFRPV